MQTCCRPFWITARVTGSSAAACDRREASGLEYSSGQTSRSGCRAHHCSTRSPGSISVVQSSCSTTAGPSNARPAGSQLAAVDRRLAPAAVEPDRRAARSAASASVARVRPCARARASGTARRRPITAVCRLTSTGADLRQLDLRSAASRPRSNSRCSCSRVTSRRRQRHGQDVALALELHVGAVHEARSRRPRPARARASRGRRRSAPRGSCAHQRVVELRRAAG